MTDVTIVMISYNTRELTLQTMGWLPDACPGISYEVIVLDNASSDGSADAISTAFPSATVIRSPVNLGFANAVNYAAAEAKGRYILLLNPDTTPNGPFATELMTYAADHPDRQIYAGRTLRADGSDDGNAGFGFPGLWAYTCFALGLTTAFRRSRLFNPEALPGFDRSKGGPVPAVSGCVLLIDRDLFAELGGFAPEFFMYSEDIDLCYRARDLGAQPVIVPSARVVHVGGASSSSPSKLEMLLRSKSTFIRLHWSPTRAAVGRRLLVTGVVLRAILKGGPWRHALQTRRSWLAGW